MFALFTYLPMELGSLLNTPKKSTLFGMFGAPISYISGVHLGAMHMATDITKVVLSTAGLWALVMYLSARIWIRTQTVKI